MRRFRRVPVAFFIVGLPVVAFLVAAAVAVDISSGGTENAAATPVSLSVNLNSVATPTSPAPAPTPTVAPTATPVIRTDCAVVRGTAYLSDEERAWFLRNCPDPTPVPGSAPPRQTVSAPVGQASASTIYGTTDRFAMPRLGINAPVNVSIVGADGTMGNPIGASDVVLYDFSAIPGLGGYPGAGGNTVISGHVDYGCCLAVFAPLRYVQEGDVIDYYTGDGNHFQYVVQWFGDYAPEANWGSLVNGDPNIMTLITCNGVFNTAVREYSHRRVVRAVLVQ